MANDQLYFRLHAHYSDQTIIRANRVDRDGAGRDNWIAGMFDPLTHNQLHPAADGAANVTITV